MPLEIIWSVLARARLRNIREFIEKDRPEAAERLVTRIVAVTEALRDHPYLGRAGVEPGTRELVIGGTPFIIVYRVHPNQVTINTVWHGAQRHDP